MPDSTLEFEGFNAFDHIAGCRYGTWPRRDSAKAILRTLQRAGKSVELIPWADLAGEHDEEIVLDYYTEFLTDYVETQDLLPPYTDISWYDNELSVRPIVGNAVEEVWRVLDLPNDMTDSQAGELCIQVNDHGNTTLSRWTVYAEKPSEWVTIWSVV